MKRGEEAESLALAFLEENGLEKLARNYRCRTGEIDLIMKEGETIVFVEVRQRSGSAFGGAAESITREKRKRIGNAARHYLARLDALPECRFDAVLYDASGTPEWIRGAFDMPDGRTTRFR